MRHSLFPAYGEIDGVTILYTSIESGYIVKHRNKSLEGFNHIDRLGIGYNFHRAKDVTESNLHNFCEGLIGGVDLFKKALDENHYIDYPYGSQMESNMIFKYKSSRIDMRNVYGVDDLTRSFDFESETIIGGEIKLNKREIPEGQRETFIDVLMTVDGNMLNKELKSTQADEFLKCYDEFTAGELK